MFGMPSRTIVLMAGLLAFSGCANDPEGADFIPEPSSGTASVGGIISVNGDPVAGEEVELHRMGAPDGPEVTAVADALGRYSFVDVEPGDYKLIVATTVETDAELQSGLAGLRWDEPCSADGFAVLNVPVFNDETDEQAVVATASNEEQPFGLDRLDRVQVDLEFTCL